MLFFPERVALLGIFAYATLFAISPLEVVFPISWESLGYIAWCYMAFLCGCQLNPQKIAPPRSLQKKHFNRAFWLISAIGAIGLGLRLYDKWVLRGASLAGSAIESREILAEAAAGPLSAVAGALYPFCFAPLILLWATRGNRRSATEKWVATTLFIIPAIDALILLSRSQILITLSMMYFAATCALYQGKFLPKKLAVPIGFGITSLAAISIITFSTRLNQMEVDLAYSIINSAYGYVVTPNSYAQTLMNDTNTIAGNLVTAILPMAQYYIHGVFEFGLLWDRPDPQEFAYGSHHFAPYVKILTMTGVSNASDTTSLFFRPGVFTTFFGPVWVDFGWAGPFFMLLFGLLCKKIANEAKKGCVAALPIHAYLSAVVFFMPVVNFLVSAQGMYVVTALLLIWISMRKQIVLSRHPKSPSSIS